MRKRKLSQKFIIGIDEVGRGALAGLVTVAAVLLPTELKIKSASWLIKFKIPLRDSKKLSSKQREEWFKWIKKHTNKLENVRMFYAVESVSPKIIDKINISQAANLAATKAFKKLIKKSKNYKIKNLKILLDGGLYLDKKALVANGYALTPKTIIRGDEKIPAISLASIIAKVHRDKLMKRLHKKYPRYDFINNVGYGTKKHIKALRKFGHSPIHRKTFHGVV